MVRLPEQFPKIVEVWWVHNIPIAGGWTQAQDFDEPLVLKDIGYLISDEPDFITLASELGVHDSEVYNHALTIRREQIYEMKTVRDGSYHT